jgi:hypothetical protein
LSFLLPHGKKSHLSFPLWKNSEGPGPAWCVPPPPPVRPPPPARPPPVWPPPPVRPPPAGPAAAAVGSAAAAVGSAAIRRPDRRRPADLGRLSERLNKMLYKIVICKSDATHFIGNLLNMMQWVKIFHQKKGTMQYDAMFCKNFHQKNCTNRVEYAVLPLLISAQTFLLLLLVVLPF